MGKISGSAIALLFIVAAQINSGFSPAHVTTLNAGRDIQDDDQQPRLVLQLGHTNEGVSAVALSPDGRFVVTASSDSTACLWDAATGRELRRFSGHTEPVNAVAFSPDGRLILTGSGTVEDSKDNSARLWDIATGHEVRRFDGHTSGVNSVAFSPDGSQLLTGSNDKSARLWDAATGRQVRLLTEVSTYVTAAAFVPHSQYIVIGSFLGPATLWDSSTGTKVRTFTPAETRLASVACLAVSPDGQTLATAGEGNRAIYLWDVQTGKELRKLTGHTGMIQAIAFSPDGGSMLTGSGTYGVTKDYSARLWDVATGKELRRFEGHTSELTSVAFSRDGTAALTGSGDDTARLWKLTTGQEIRRFEGSSQSVRAVALSNDGRYVLTGLADNSARLWDNSSGRIAQVFKTPTPGEVTSVALSADSRLALTGSSDGTARLWNIETGQEQRAFTGPALKNAGPDTGRVMSVNAVAFSSDARLIATGSGDQTTRVWDVATGRMLKQLGQLYTLPDEPLPMPPSAVTCIAFSPDGKQILSARAFDPNVYLWDVATGKQLRVFRSPEFKGTDIIRAIAFSPDGRNVLSGGTDKTPRLWDVATGFLLKTFTGDVDKITAVGFSPDGRKILTGSLDGITRLWDIETSHVTGRFVVGGVPVSLAFTKDARYVLTGALDSTARFWDVTTGKELCRLVSLKDDTWVVVAPDGRFDTNNLEGIEGLHWIMPDDPFTALPIEIFMRQYYEPRLLPRLLAGDEFAKIPSLASLNRSQPKISITQIQSEPNTPEEVSVTVELEKGARSGVYSLRLFRDGQLVGYAPQSANQSVNPGTPQSIEAELNEWRQSQEIKMDMSGKGTLTFPHIKLPRKLDIKQVGFSAYAFNIDKVKSATERKGFDFPVNLAPIKGRAYIIAVGVNAYENPEWNLKYAANDARQVQRTLFDRLSKGGEFQEVVQISLISDYETKNGQDVDTEKSATKQNIRAVLDLLAGKQVDPEVLKSLPNADKLRKATPDDLVIISFSSHGYADNRGNFYFFPYDVGPGSKREITSDLLKHCISSEELSLWLRDVDAGKMAMIVDACHSAASVQGEGFKPGPMGSRGLGQLSYDKGMRILTSTQSDDVALETDFTQQGLLTYALTREGIEAGKADFKPQDKAIMLTEWLEYAADRVPKLYVEIEQKYQSLALNDLRGIGVGPGGRTKLLIFSRDGTNSSLKKSSNQQPSLFDFTRKKREVVIAKTK